MGFSAHFSTECLLPHCSPEHTAMRALAAAADHTTFNFCVQATPTLASHFTLSCPRGRVGIVTPHSLLFGDSLREGQRWDVVVDRTVRVSESQLAVHQHGAYKKRTRTSSQSCKWTEERVSEGEGGCDLMRAKSQPGWSIAAYSSVSVVNKAAYTIPAIPLFLPSFPNWRLEARWLEEEEEGKFVFC